MAIDDRRDSIASALTGLSLGHYRLGRSIGAGRFAVVFEAEDDRTGKIVAVKVLFPGGKPEDTVEFSREAKLLAKMSGSSNVVKMFDTGNFPVTVDFSGTPIPIDIAYHTLERADGTLADLIARRNEIALCERLRLWRGAVLGVHQLHLRNVVHRDIKASNFLVFLGAKDSSTCKVSDLGRGRDILVPAEHAPFSYVMGRGDLSFAPPEHLMWQGKNSKESHVLEDLYGLGSLLFEIVTGQGITSMALGNHAEIMKDSLLAYARNETVDLSSLHTAYEPCFALFEDGLPGALRVHAGGLLRMLCSPEPTRRRPRLASTGRRIVHPGLYWLLTRADIAIKTSIILSRTQMRHPVVARGA